jgi:hypothetical protein
MIAEAMMPSPGAAKGVVPKKGMGMAFWIAGVPGRADIVKVEVPSAIVAGISRRGTPAELEQRLGHGRHHEDRDEEADAAIGDRGAGQYHRQHARPVPSFSVIQRAMAETEPLSSISLPKSAPSRNSGKNCAMKPRRCP